MRKTYKVCVVDLDFYARNAIASYLAWDRRTRVIAKLEHLAELYEYLATLGVPELPDTLLLDSYLLEAGEDAQTILKQIQHFCPQAHVILMALRPQPALALALMPAGARGYVLRSEVGLQVASMVVWARDYAFVTTPGAAHLFPEAALLPNKRNYPMSDRVRQALMLYAVEGMSAELAADEMGVSPNTVNDYIKRAYEILASSDTEIYPPNLSAKEVAFMRFTSFALDDETLDRL
jgi:DNA-binding NarL/FixJ family response regulator